MCLLVNHLNIFVTYTMVGKYKNCLYLTQKKIEYVRLSTISRSLIKYKQMCDTGHLTKGQIFLLALEHTQDALWSILKS